MAAHTPSDGDVLITKSPSDGHFDISIVPGDAQLRVQHKYQAVQHAHAFAAQTGVSVWFVDGATSCTRVEGPAGKES